MTVEGECDVNNSWWNVWFRARFYMSVTLPLSLTEKIEMLTKAKTLQRPTLRIGWWLMGEYRVYGLRVPRLGLGAPFTTFTDNFVRRIWKVYLVTGDRKRLGNNHSKHRKPVLAPIWLFSEMIENNKEAEANQQDDHFSQFISRWSHSKYIENSNKMTRNYGVECWFSWTAASHIFETTC